MDDYYQLLSHVEGLGYRRLELLIKYFGSIERVWMSGAKKWLELGIDKETVSNFRETKNKNLVLHRNYISYENKIYPDRLREIASPPIGLFYEGDVELLKSKSVAVVGTRKMSRYGMEMTEMFTKSLVKRGVVIVSGLASGVDAVAHETCVRNGGRTIAVLAHGLDKMYPSVNANLRKRIIESGGLVITEYPYGFEPAPKRFVVRNRIVAGLSKAVLVTEAPVKSGTKITVGFAGEQGKDVYVVPGPINSYGYKGSVDIIRDGGIPVASASDIDL